MKTPLLFLAVNSILACASIQAAVVGYWKFEGESFLNDSSGNNYHLTNNATAVQLDLPATGNGSEFASAISGNTNAMQFDGNDRMAVAYNAAFKTSTMTLEALVSTTATSGAQNIVGMWGSVAADRIYLLALTGNNILTYYYNGNNLQSGLPGLVPNNDYYVGISIDLTDATGNALTFYQKNLNTGETWTSSVARPTTALAGGNASISIGATSAPAAYFKGLIDEVRISNTKLGPEGLLVQIPEPSAALLGSLAVLVGLRRKRVA
jgi:hypothetical protein